MTTNHLAQAMDHARGVMRNGCAVELEPQVVWTDTDGNDQ